MKVKPFRSKKYLKNIKKQRCVMCFSPSDDPHHAIGLGLGGMGTKAPDSSAMPMCRGCHTKIHNNPELWPKQWEWMWSTILKEISSDGLRGTLPGKWSVTTHEDLVRKAMKLFDSGELIVV